MNLSRSIGWPASPSGAPDRRLIQYINLKLASIGCPTFGGTEESEIAEVARALLVHQRETDRLLPNYLCPADNRIQSFLYEYLQDVAAPPKLPVQTFILDRHGLARSLSLPRVANEFSSGLTKA